MLAIKPNRLQDLSFLILRIVVALVMIYTGSQKVFGSFGGPGYAGTFGLFRHMGFADFWTFLAMAGELAGGLGLLFGVLTRVAAFGVFCTMGVATYMTATMPNAIANIFEGKPQAISMVFFPLVLCAAALTILLNGGGSWTLDTVIFGSGKGKSQSPA